MQDYRYTIHKEGKQIIQRQVIDNLGVIIITENRAAKVADVVAMTDYGNYCYHFDCASSVSELMRSADDYLMDRFLTGHDEIRILNVPQTVRTIDRRFHLDPKARKELAECHATDDVIEWAERWKIDTLTAKRLCVHGYGRWARLFADRVLPAIRESGKQFAQMCAGMVD
ncbi:MAG: hypothetical protein PHY12_05795 [Eubacteriales bacterium]|nr:hypothetical protein [Eubacteriales bacterium]